MEPENNPANASLSRPCMRRRGPLQPTSPQPQRANNPRAQRIMQLPLEYVPNEQFAAWLGDQKTEDEVLAPMPACGESPDAGFHSPCTCSSAGASATLTRAQEVHLFRKMNYLKYKASALRKTFDPLQPEEALMTQIEDLYHEIVAAKNQIISANLPLVVSIAGRRIGPAQDILELISDGNLSLIGAVEQFDYALGYKFSTYATSAILNRLARTFRLTLRQRDRFRTNQSDLFSAALDFRGRQREFEVADGGREIDGILRRLDERERKVIVCRFGLQNGRQPQTLKQVGEALGVSKERIRQIQDRALQKLRQVAMQNGGSARPSAASRRRRPSQSAAILPN